SALLVLPVTVADDGTGGLKYGNLYNELLEYVIPVDVTFYALMVGAVIALRIKAPAMDRPYRAIGYPLPILVYIGLAILLVLDFIYLKPWTSGKGYLIVLAGIPVYLVWSRVAAARGGVGWGRPGRPPACAPRVAEAGGGAGTRGGTHRAHGSSGGRRV